MLYFNTQPYTKLTHDTIKGQINFYYWPNNGNMNFKSRPNEVKSKMSQVLSQCRVTVK